MTASDAAALKEQGNAEYKSGAYLKAAATYTKAIKADPQNEVLYSNRCAALTSLKKIQKAVADADMCIKLKPTWEKGYFRKGSAHEMGEEYEQALEAFKEALELNPKAADVAAKIKNLSKLIREKKREAGMIPQEGQSGFIKSDEEYTEAKKHMGKGEVIAVDEKRILGFAKETISAAISQYLEQDGDLEPVASFLPGTKEEGGEETIGQVAIKQAFDSPDMLANCTEFLRQYGADMKAHAACLVVPRDCIAFPQVWKKTHLSRDLRWEHGNKTGFFVQLDSPKLKLMWFVPSGKEKGKLIPQGAESLDWEHFKLVPPLFK